MDDNQIVHHQFTEVNPDKGTETSFETLLIYMFHLFTEVNPDKGTETNLSTYCYQSTALQFTEVNPDKGTETMLNLKD